MPPRRNRRQEVYRKRLLSRRYKTKKIEIVSRKGQPQVVAEVRRIKSSRISQVGGSISSSWIAYLNWLGNNKAIMKTKEGYNYEIAIPFEVFERWFYANSKGTFFNYEVKDKYPIRRTL